MNGGDFDIVQWIGPLLNLENRRRLKAEVKALRAMSHDRPYFFPDGIHKKRKSFGLSTAFEARFQHQVPWNAPVDSVHAALTKAGARSTCRVISPAETYEYGIEAPLLPALESALTDPDWQDQEVVLMCLPGRLLYWQDQNGHRTIVWRQD